MKYIILDLEWDSAYFPPQKKFINQILQIGAVKLDENFNVIDEFSVNVCSSISKRVTSFCTKLTGITTEIMRAGISLYDAVKQYNDFSSDCDVAMTWSDSDLYAIMENEEHLLKNKIRFNFKKYLDLQKLVQIYLANGGMEIKNQVSLENAAELLSINIEDFHLHTAVEDSKISAILLKKCYNESAFNSLVKDTSASDFYQRLRFKPYSISNINDSQINKADLKFECPECNAKTTRKTKWKYKNRWFSADFQCNNCKHKFSGLVMFRKTYDDLLVRHKVKPIKIKTNKTKEEV